ncbi:uncharacterized protein PV09_08797 [Verruconis gallopava]|uniref:C2H2-type domain-containing protein n=1 Tax=Verruconis gallopava TaxID=253628 RepID=A0A0D1YFG8_9PEZI|nr:uncharacterized protein PV09_08797 [Verruconis gallopava]KIV99491.1 hypothetical protein PV09_08797 [Verruconis gallopava]
MANLDLAFLSFETETDSGLHSWCAAMAEPISRPPSVRAQFLYGIGAGTNLHPDSHCMHQLYLDSSEFESYRPYDNAFLPNQKAQDFSFSSFQMKFSHESFEYSSPLSDYSSQSGDTFSASCYTLELNQSMQQHPPNTTGLITQGSYYPTSKSMAQSPQLVPNLGGGISLGEVQNFRDQLLDRSHDDQNPPCSEPDAEGESDDDYVAMLSSEPTTKWTSCVDKSLGESIADSSTQDSISEDYDPEEEKDGEYNPRPSTARRSRRARATIRKQSHCRRTSNATRGRIAKSKTRKPSNASQSRPFPCPISQYGCTSTFTSKNEWKRHVSTQHIKLGFWRCDMCPPANPENPVYNDFNRKDLFTQHLRRMHKHHPLTIGTSVDGEGNPEISDEAMKEHQDRCYRRLRQNPAKSTCLFCGKLFEGEGSWEERMEHVGGHMEKERKANKPPVPVDEWHEDLDLRDYLECEGLIEFDDGKWSISDGVPRRDQHLAYHAC